MSVRFTESEVEEAALVWLSDLGYTVKHASELSESGERTSYEQVILQERLRVALASHNPNLPPEALDDAFRRIVRVGDSSLVTRNRALHRMLVDGVNVEYRRADGSTAGAQAYAIDFEHPERNDWLAVNQLTVMEEKHHRRPDIVLFLNGLPMVVIELKNAADEKADIWSAFNQLRTYKEEIPSLFTSNAALVVSDGMQARIGTLTADRERFMPWRTIDGASIAEGAPQLRVLLQGVFEHRRFLDLLRFFIVFEEIPGAGLLKKMAGYHQFHAVNTALMQTLRATGRDTIDNASSPFPGGYLAWGMGGKRGDHRVGVVWHTQGSGKSLTMAFYAGRVIAAPAMENPTLVMLTDRNDLDDQLFQTFARCSELLRQSPVRVESRSDLREKLRTAAGGVVFTTIQKFLPDTKGDRMPLLSDRRNIVVIADEAHRSQYDFIDGFARHMRDALPNASFIGFTGTPIEKTDANTRSVFGDYISVYDIRRAVEDGATVPIYYEARLAKLALDEVERPTIDPSFEEVTEGEEVERKEKLKSKWAQLEALVGTEKRLALLADDLVKHFELRLDAINGKALIVGMSRRICIALYDALVKLRPEWHSDDDAMGAIKVVMTGSAADPPEWQLHIRGKQELEAMAQRFRDPDDPLKIVIVRDMWLTGFDVPCLHTMYLDKPMRGHALMQAIARVNRVFHDKPGGLVVDYLGLADELRQAVETYTDAGGTGKAKHDPDEAVAVMREKYEICCALFHGFDRSPWTGGKPADRLNLLPLALEHILAQQDGKTRLLDVVTTLSSAFALAVPNDEALKIRDDVSFFQAVRAALVKLPSGEGRSGEQLDHAVRQIVSRAVAADEIVDLFSVAGLKKPDLSILSEDFLADVRSLPQKNLAVELLRRLLVDGIKARFRKNVVQARSFEELLKQALRRYQNRAVEAAMVIEELIRIAEQLREAQARGESLGLSEAELAFYDALADNESAIQVLGDAQLQLIARELLQSVRSNASLDWMVRENVRAKLRVLVKRTLKKYGYPPDKQEKATDTVLEQAETLSQEWAAA